MLCVQLAVDLHLCQSGVQVPLQLVDEDPAALGLLQHAADDRLLLVHGAERRGQLLPGSRQLLRGRIQLQPPAESHS